MRLFVLVMLLMAFSVEVEMASSPSSFLRAWGSCQGRCGIEDNTQLCQCNSMCTTFGDCCSDYSSVCLSCKGRCAEGFNRKRPCHCNKGCVSHNNCCRDYNDACLSCKGRCGEGYQSAKPCQCNSNCANYGNCCHDFSSVCDGGSTSESVTNTELRTITEELFDLDVNNVFQHLTLNHQGKTSSSASNDVASAPFFTNVEPAALQGPTVSAMYKLLDNYIPSVTVSESVTSSEMKEQTAFLNAVMNTEVMKETEAFLKRKGLVNDLRVKLDEIWFTMYNRGRRSGGTSSGFEHSFVGELKNGKVSGFHNWVSFYKEETERDLDYKGFINKVSLSSNTGNRRKAEILLTRFTWEQEKKPIGSVFIGTSPELELAVYTICFYARPDKRCTVQMGGKRFNIQTWTYKSGGKLLVGSAYPDIPSNYGRSRNNRRG
ncbi:uridylate-specific endoribonuclease A-like isoform X2 [Oratosquilla oratoria]|uniref:uridylate-specific endoribonuclease A-like isoform X2 n=1 Tax=Oratosquilla oratoria TaxID=337810 RepID=UPI003F7636EB